MMVIGSLASIANGALQPLLMLVFTSIIDDFTDYGRLCNLTMMTMNESLNANITIPFSSESLLNKTKTQAIYLISN
jgi:hypothetical protein